LGSLTASPQDGELSIDDAVRIGQQFLEDNVDPKVLDQLSKNVDPKVVQFLAELQDKLNGEYVIDLAELRKTANVILPLLDANEETAPYAAWLRARLDYLDAADQFRRLVPPPKIEPGKPTPPPQIPSLAMEKKVWVNLLQERPVPKEAQPYIIKLKPLFSAQGVPEQLFWLAEVESGFNATARSPAGAAGLYQMMPATAKSLGLSVHWPDERLNPEKITPAAARYLKKLHDHFKDWRLTLAAYNVGEGRVDELLKRHSAKSFDEISQYLPAETQLYVPKFEALLQKREGLTLAQLKTNP
jgi:membrane-bound lytic murein transglycosylase D